MADILTVNGFTFCADHGWELCHRCPYDFRSINNYAIQDELDEEIAEWLDQDRSFMYNIYDIGIEKASKAGKSRAPRYMCTAHKEEDCSTCFNWAERVTKEIQKELKDEKWLTKRQKYFDRCD